MAEHYVEAQIWSTELTRARADEIANASEQLREGIRVWRASQLGFFRWRPFLELPDLTNYVAEDADWHAATWDFTREGLTRLGRTFEWLYDELPGPFSFHATWGPVTIGKLAITRGKLLEAVADSSISTTTVYEVAGE